MKKCLLGLGALLSYILCMLLPLVGRSGSTAPWALQNRYTFLAVLLAALAATSAGLWLHPRKFLPWGLLLAGQGILLLATLTGLISI